MPFRIVDSATRSACAAATNQQAQLEALIAPWAGAPVTARLYTTGGTLLRTITLPALTVAGSPPSIALGSHTGDTAVSTGTPGMWVFSNGATEIFRMDAGLTGALINHVGAVKTGCTPTLSGVVVTANPLLPDVATWGSGSNAGSLVGDVWTPGRDGSGRVNLASWNTVPTGRWIEVAGTRIDEQLTASVQAVSSGWTLQQLWGDTNGSNLMQSWSGFAVDQANARFFFFGGGHSDGYNNGLYRFDLYRMSWAIQCPPTPRSTMSAAYLSNGSSTNHPDATATAAANFNANNPAGTTTGTLVPVTNGPMYDEIPSDLKPTARHSYQGLVYVPSIGTAGSVLMHARRLWRYDIASGAWVLRRLVNDQARSTGGAAPNATGVIEIHAAEASLVLWDEVAGKVLCSASGSNGSGAYAFTWSSQTWASWIGAYGLNFNDAAVVRQSRTVVSFNAPAATGAREGRYWVHDLDAGTTTSGTDVQFGGGLTRADFQAADAFYDAYAMVYVPPLNRYWIWTRNSTGGMQALQLDPTTTPWTLSPLSFANASPIEERLAQGRTHWIEALNAVLVWDHCFVGCKIYRF